MNLNNLINTFGWTIINSLWQGLFILLLLAILLIIINPKHAKIRSFVAYASLLFVFAASIRTFNDLVIIETNSVNLIGNNSDQKFSNFLLFNDLSTQVENNSDNKIGINSILKSISIFGNQYLMYIVIIWLSGVLFLTIRMLGGYFYMQNIKKKNIQHVENKWVQMIKTISNNLQLSKTVKLFESTIVKYPTVIGFFKPVILMPLGSLAEMSMVQVEMILAHELAHIKRADYILNLIQSFLEILYFFNPSVWLISKIIRNEREFACDDLAISINNDGTILAQALLAVHQTETDRPAVALSLLGTKYSLLRRIKRMVQKNNYKANYPKRFALSAVLLGGLFTLTIIACSSASDNYIDRYQANSANVYNNETQSNLESDNVENVFEVEPIEAIESVSKIDKISPRDNIDDKRKFNFHKDGTHWKGTVENGKVTRLYKDGERISDKNIHEYENFILNTLEEIDEDIVQLEIDMKGFKEEMTKLKEDLSDLEIDVNFDHLDEINEHFNSEEFHKEMSNLKESLNEMKFNFDGEWKDELKSELEKLDDMDFDFDKESFKESMRELKENMKDFKIDMSDLDIDLSDLKIDLKDLKVEMKMLKSFLNEFREDLVKEGYIQSEDEDFELELNKSTIEVNGKKLPNNLHKRYLKMYKDHFGKELENDFTIRN